MKQDQKRLTPIEKIQKINQKIEKLKLQQQNVQKTFETKITALLKKEKAYHHDFNVLYGAILDVCEKINDHNNTDQISAFHEKGNLALSKKNKKESIIDESKKILKPK